MTEYSGLADGILPETVELAQRRLVGVLRHLRGFDLLAKLVDVGLGRIGFAELVLDGLELLAQVVLALVLVHLLLDVGLDLVAEFEHVELARSGRR